MEDAISTAHTFEVTVNRQKAELQEALSAVDAGKKREADQQVAIDSLQEKLSNIENALAEMREKPYQESDQLLYPTDIDEFSSSYPCGYGNQFHFVKIAQKTIQN